jgi:hypothetical protein
MKIHLYSLLLFSSFGTFRFCGSDNEIIKPENVTLTEKWSTTAALKTPESVLYDDSRRVIFVSNINGFNNSLRDGDGFISVLK